jgi:hypothetical protein
VRINRLGKVPTLAALVSRITPENRYDEIYIGPAVGKDQASYCTSLDILSAS